MYLSIDSLDNISDAEDYKCFQKPYVIRGGCKEMTIFKEKDPLDYIYHELYDHVFPVETYKTIDEMEKTDVHKFKELRFSTIIDRMHKKDEPEYYYIADVNLEELNISSKFMDKFNVEFDTMRESFGKLIFLGNNSKTGAHIHNGHDYVLNQVIGKKIVYMWDYYDNDLEFAGLFDLRMNFIKDNIFKLDHSKLKIYKVELEAGDSLVIPPWWLHAVEGIGTTVSITKRYVRTDIFYYNKPYMMGYILMNEIIDNFSEIKILALTLYHTSIYSWVIIFIIVIIFVSLGKNIYQKYIKNIFSNTI